MHPCPTSFTFLFFAFKASKLYPQASSRSALVQNSISSNESTSPQLKAHRVCKTDMTSTNKVSILCRYGGNFVEESDKISYKDGTNRMILLGAQEINYPSLLSKLLQVCKWTQIGMIKYKHLELGLDCLISVENDEDLCNMMQAFKTQNNGLIQLFLFKAQETLPIHNTIPSDEEIVKVAGQNHQESKEMPLQLNSNMDINVKTAIIPPDRLQLGMDDELGMDNHNLPTNNSVEYGCANDNMVAKPRMKLEEGQEFPDANVFHKFLRDYAIRSKFEYKRTRSGHGHFAARCRKEDCPWRIQAHRLSNQSTFKIKSLKGKHTCGNLDEHWKVTSHHQATRKWIADFVEHRNYFKYTPKVIADMIEKEYGIEVHYDKVWRGRELALKRNSIANGGYAPTRGLMMIQPAERQEMGLLSFNQIYQILSS